MSVLGVLLVALGSALAAGGALASRRRRAQKDEPPPARVAALPGFQVAPGSVISVGGEEAWLERGWLLEEADAAVAAVLFADKVIVLALPAPSSALYWLSEHRAPPLVGEPPPTLTVDGERFERARRVPVGVRALDGAREPPWPSALLAEYRALGGSVLWLLAHGNEALSWRGRRIDDSELDNWGVGESALDR